MSKRFFLVGTVLVIGLLFLTGCHVIRALKYWAPDITDYKIFPARALKKSSEPFKFKKVGQQLDFSSICYKGGIINLDKYNEERQSTAFLIIRNDSILFEKYYNDYCDTSISTSFSLAKSFTSVLIGCAIDDGLIKSTKQSVREYLPELKPEYDALTIEHLLQMTSGLRCKEDNWNPITGAALTYYGPNERKVIYNLRFKSAPGTRFEYQSVNTIILGMILERVLKPQTVTQYLQEKIWSPLQMEYDATWSIDGKRSNLEKVYCCLNAKARDYAKLGRLYLNNGVWNGKTIVSKSWVDRCRTSTLENGARWDYQYGWYIASRLNGGFYASGYLGQYVYVYPKKNLVIVRLGKRRDGGWVTLFKDLAKML